MTAAQTTNLQALRQPAAQASNAPAVHAGFFDLQSFELMQRVSKPSRLPTWCRSSIAVPTRSRTA
jgi:hypothetical protein